MGVVPMAEYRASLRTIPDCHCKGCGKRFRPSGRDRMTYCSRPCAYAHRAAKPKAVAERAPIRCLVCSGQFVPRNKRHCCCSDPCRTMWDRVQAQRSYRDAHPRKAFACSECGKVCLPAHGAKNRTFCGEVCARRHGRRVARHVRRARTKSVFYERVDPMRVFDRDRWRCQLCWVKTPKRYRGSLNPNAPELDHIVPLSVGGEHSYRNTQCACRSCNQAKGSEVRGQLRLVG